MRDLFWIRPRPSRQASQVNRIRSNGKWSSRAKNRKTMRTIRSSPLLHTRSSYTQFNRALGFFLRRKQVRRRDAYISAEMKSEVASELPVITYFCRSISLVVKKEKYGRNVCLEQMAQKKGVQEGGSLYLRSVRPSCFSWRWPFRPAEGILRCAGIYVRPQVICRVLPPPAFVDQRCGPPGGPGISRIAVHGGW